MTSDCIVEFCNIVFIVVSAIIKTTKDKQSLSPLQTDSARPSLKEYLGLSVPCPRIPRLVRREIH